MGPDVTRVIWVREAIFMRDDVRRYFMEEGQGKRAKRVKGEIRGEAPITRRVILYNVE